MDSSERLVASNARVPILNYQLVDESPAYDSLPDAIAAAEREELIHFDTAFVNVSHGSSGTNEPLPVVLLRDAVRPFAVKWGEAFIGRVGSQHLVYRWNSGKDWKGASLMS